jgi:putative nucleotidyltransferase with HDIG domain
MGIDTLTPGLVLGKPLYDDQGRVLLSARVALTQSYIDALRNKGYLHVYVRDEAEPEQVESDDDLSQETRARATKTMQNAFDAIRSDFVGTLRDVSMESVRESLGSKQVRALMGSKGPLAAVHNLVSSILDEVLTRPVLAGLTSLKSADSRLYGHSLDVCVVAIMIARAVGQPQNRMKQLAVGCLLHDIGHIFLKEGLSADARVRQHTQLGYELLRQSDDPDVLAPHVAWEHHEHQDGSGLPRGLDGCNTIKRERNMNRPTPTLIGEIAAVANTYDNLLTGTSGEPPVPPDEAIRRVRSMAGTVLNREVVAAFLRTVPVFPRGTTVVVTEGKYKFFTGIVVEVNLNHLDQPKIALFRDRNGQPIQPVELDLTRHPDTIIRSNVR